MHLSEPVVDVTVIILKTPDLNMLVLQVEDVQVCPQTMCAVGGDLVVFDSADSRLVSASSGKWGNRMLRGLGKSSQSLFELRAGINL